MKKNVLKTLFLIFISTIFCAAQKPINEWQGIRPLHSTRDDVEKLLGKPIKGETHIYDTQKARVTVTYTKETCKENKASSYNVPKDTVLHLLVGLKEPLNVREITEKSSQRFNKIADPKVERVNHYFSEDSSVSFETKVSANNMERIQYIVYRTTKADDYLMCSSQKDVS